MRVLIVSRNSVTRALLVSLLPSSGFELVTADSLPRALAVAPTANCDVALIHADIVRVNPDALDRLREVTGRSLPVVLVDRSYSDERRGLDEARTFGAAAFVPLPPEPALLEEVLRMAKTGVGAQTTTGRFAVAAAVESHEASGAHDGERTAQYAKRLWSRLGELDAYQILRVPPDATDTEIQSAFRQRALEFHPDRQHGPMDEETREHVYQIFKRVSRAFREVGDPMARRAYDALRRNDSK